MGDATDVPAPGAPKKRKRATLIMMSTADTAAPSNSEAPASGPAAGSTSKPVVTGSERQAVSVDDDAPAEGAWSTDSTNDWEVWIRSSSDSDCRLRGLKKGSLVWERPVSGSVQRLTVDGGFVVAAVGLELHVLKLCDGHAALPPLCLSSTPVVLKLNTEGYLVLMCRDGSVTVWNLPECKCCIQTSLVSQCSLADLEDLDVKIGSGEPFARLRDGSILVFHKDLRSWMFLSSPSTEPEDLSPDATQSRTRSTVAVRLERDLLVAAYLGDAALFRDHLNNLCWFFAREDLGALRRWLATILNANLHSAKPWPLLASDLSRADLDASSLLREVVLPVLRAVPSAQSLRSELEDLAGGAVVEALF